MPGTWTNVGGGTTITEVANYGAFAAGSDGDLGKTTNNNLYWTYNGAAALWLPPNIQPTSLVVNYDSSVLPTADTPAWTKSGTEGVVADGELTITDDGGSYAYYYLVDATNFVDSKNIGFIMRAKVTAQAAVASASKGFFGLRPSSEDVACLSIARGTALSGTNNVGMWDPVSGTLVGGDPDVSVDNAAYHIYYIWYFHATDTFQMGTLDDTYLIGALHDKGFSASYLGATSAWFGTFDSANTSTLVIDYVKIFNF